MQPFKLELNNFFKKLARLAVLIKTVVTVAKAM